MADPTEATTTETGSEETGTSTETTETVDDAAKWKELSRKNERAHKAALKEIEQLKQASMSEQEKAVEAAREEGRKEGSAKATDRLRISAVREAAAGLLANPGLAPKLLDLEKYQPDDDGEFDRKAIQADITALVKDEPYLGATPGNGSGEGGPRGSAPQPNKTSDPLLESVQKLAGVRQ